jgi:hypothetical protein
VPAVLPLLQQPSILHTEDTDTAAAATAISSAWRGYAARRDFWAGPSFRFVPTEKSRAAPRMDAADVLAQAQDAVEFAEERCAAARAPALHAERASPRLAPVAEPRRNRRLRAASGAGAGPQLESELSAAEAALAGARRATPRSFALGR